MSNKRALVAMSGGVDSAVTAYLLCRQGYTCTGATMLLCGNEDTAGAEAICRLLGMEFRVYDFRETFHREVVTPFVTSYEHGETPNPCIFCNEKLKFGELYRIAMEEGFDVLATGHYARIGEQDGRRVLCKAADEKKDQSYVLYALTREQLAHVAFPLGELTKEQARAIAVENGFSNAKKGTVRTFVLSRMGIMRGLSAASPGKTIPWESLWISAAG